MMMGIMGYFIQVNKMSELQKVVDEVSSHVNSVTNLNSFESVRLGS